MDAAGLTILLKEMEADCAVARDAATKAAQRVNEKTPGHLEACAYELARLYNTFERMLERVCDEFENHFEKRGDYHERLLQRLSLHMEGIRPPLIPKGWVEKLRELKGFRHVMRHAYDITLRSDRLAELARIGEQLAAELPRWCKEFVDEVRTEQGWTV
jgi:Rad3-related DNA helicase